MMVWLVALGGVLAVAGVSLWWSGRVSALRRESARQLEAARQGEERLRLQLELERLGHEAVFNCMTEGLLVLGPDRRVRISNGTVHRFFGVEAELRGRTLMEALRRHELEDLAARARVEGQALGLVLEVDAGRGQTRHLQVNASVFQDAPGAEPGFILVFHDITRLRELENTRREFVANVSHELRTPLALIKGYVETLIDGARNDAEVSLRFLQTIEKHANRLTFLIEDLLTIAQLEGGQVAMNRQLGPLRPMAARILEDLQSRAVARDITLVNEVPEDLQARVDFDRVQQVFFNLVDNAIKYGRQGGRVVVGARVDATRERVEAWVTDDGPGIPRESLERVFERFYRVDAGRSRDQGGTGLGLSIVKHIVQAHGGEVRAESEPGRGATFRLTLPWEGGAGLGAEQAAAE